MIYTIGIDIGSTTSKCVLLENGEKIIAKSLLQAGTGTSGPEKSFQELLNKGHLNRADISYVMATGYGRTTFEDRDDEMSELSCHAKGVSKTSKDVRTIIDIGGQDAKVIQINDSGIISNFVMNDKCAAGTGRFLDVMSNILQLDIGELEIYARRAENPVKISSTCTVFAESEVISQLSKGVNLDELVAGICASVGSRVAALAKRIGVKDNVYMSGGVAKNGGVRDALEKELNTEIYYTDESQYMGALGAAMIAYEKVRSI